MWEEGKWLGEGENVILSVYWMRCVLGVTSTVVLRSSWQPLPLLPVSLPRTIQPEPEKNGPGPSFKMTRYCSKTSAGRRKTRQRKILCNCISLMSWQSGWRAGPSHSINYKPETRREVLRITYGSVWPQKPLEQFVPKWNIHDWEKR